MLDNTPGIESGSVRPPLEHLGISRDGHVRGARVVHSTEVEDEVPGHDTSGEVEGGPCPKGNSYCGVSGGDGRIILRCP